MSYGYVFKTEDIYTISLLTVFETNIEIWKNKYRKFIMNSSGLKTGNWKYLTQNAIYALFIVFQSRLYSFKQKI